MIYGWRIVSNGPPAVLLYRKVRRRNGRTSSNLPILQNIK